MAVASLCTTPSSIASLSASDSQSSVFRAVHIEDHRVAACKLISLTPATTDKDRKNVDKEMRVHSALKHRNVLEFVTAAVVELKHQHQYVPGIYMLLEFAAGGDLFDKIGKHLGVYTEHCR